MRALLSWVAIVVVAVLPVTAEENAESPISIVAIAYQDTIPRGFTGDVETIVENVTDHQTVWVTFHGQITYADGTVEVITDMEPEQAVEIGPGQALSQRTRCAARTTSNNSELEYIFITMTRSGCLREG